MRFFFGQIGGFYQLTTDKSPSIPSILHAFCFFKGSCHLGKQKPGPFPEPNEITFQISLYQTITILKQKIYFILEDNPLTCIIVYFLYFFKATSPFYSLTCTNPKTANNTQMKARSCWQIRTWEAPSRKNHIEVLLTLNVCGHPWWVAFFSPADWSILLEKSFKVWERRSGPEVGKKTICGKCTTLPSSGINRELLTTSILRVTKLFLILLNNQLGAQIKQTVQESTH